MSPPADKPVLRIPLERPASIKRLLPSFDDSGWIVSQFVVGEENPELRYLFSESTIRRLHEISPIVLYGEQATGKTALAITLAVHWARLTSLRPLSLTNGSAFCSDYAAAVEIDDIESFHNRHRTCRLLAIDALEPLASKPAAQSELSHTLDVLAAHDAPVIVTASKLPSLMTGVLPALSSRLSGGFSVPIHKLELTSQTVALDDLIARIDSTLPKQPLIDACQLLATPLSLDELQTLVRLAHQQQQHSGQVSSEVVCALMKQHLLGTSLKTATIAKAVASRLGVRLSELRGATRQARVVRARGLSILLARRLTPESLQQIGQYFGGRDHSTVLHAYRKSEQLVASDTELARVMADVESDLLG